jgi:2-oxoglutarate ferredoxin oxidoreductase subunit delta
MASKLAKTIIMNQTISSIPVLRERKVKGRVEINIERCKGCELCTATCKEQVLTLSKTINKKGYPYIVANNELCTGCVNCALVCPDGVIRVYRTSPKKKVAPVINLREQVDALISLL